MGLQSPHSNPSPPLTVWGFGMRELMSLSPSFVTTKMRPTYWCRVPVPGLTEACFLLKIPLTPRNSSNTREHSTQANLSEAGEPERLHLEWGLGKGRLRPAGPHFQEARHS